MRPKANNLLCMLFNINLDFKLFTHLTYLSRTYNFMIGLTKVLIAIVIV